ncbi:response regulator [Histidinibacterium lentulum]|uniref:Response regulator n=1 Tax=Histidinibacterium lentulum TaxID=2480588 RepID=A0A3N2R8K1_9RHOB|nr:response regulator [Histidinibacterium lentulum]ROU03748.1 response regulator [Histidinibacterium lentulum]
MTADRIPTPPGGSLAERVGTGLPFLRRHARALTGSQAAGDRFAAETLEAILADPSRLSAQGIEGRGALFAVFYDIWEAAPPNQRLSPDATGDTPDGPRGRALAHLSRLTPRSCEAMLLHTVEDFTLDEVARILGITPAEASHLVDVARREMYAAIKGSVLVIEDESVIAMDIEEIVEHMGHRVTGVATTADEAVRICAADRPDLVLADIRLADGSSGIDAVNRILASFSDMPVIFITAYPERLLTGERHEPAFMIAKPYSPSQVMSAVSQAMFFSSTETLKM